MKISPIVKTLLILLVLLFSGCATKTQIIVQKCQIEKPIKHEPINCRVIKNDFEFMQCVAENYYQLNGDYEMLEKAFEGCK